MSSRRTVTDFAQTFSSVAYASSGSRSRGLRKANHTMTDAVDAMYIHRESPLRDQLVAEPRLR